MYHEVDIMFAAATPHHCGCVTVLRSLAYRP